MKCAIMQPAYLPWAGYFNLISNVDCFVFLDDVQFERRSWQSRNRIIINGKESFLTIPTEKSPQSAIIKDMKIHQSSGWNRSHKDKLHSAYRGAAFFHELTDLIDDLYNDIPSNNSLSTMNQIIIEKISLRLGIASTFYCASNLRCGGKRSEHLAQICKALNCDTYISPVGSKQYLMEDRFQEASGIELVFQEFTPHAYEQHTSANFISHMSILDVIANKGICYSAAYSKGKHNG